MPENAPPPPPPPDDGDEKSRDVDKPQAQKFLEELAEHYGARLSGAIAVVFLEDGQTLVCRSGGLNVRDEVYGARMCTAVVEDAAFAPMRKRDAAMRQLH